MKFNFKKTKILSSIFKEAPPGDFICAQENIRDLPRYDYITKFFRFFSNNTPVKPVVQDKSREKYNKILKQAAKDDINSVLWDFNTSRIGLSRKQLEANKCQYGNNVISKDEKKPKFVLFIEAFINPFTLVLISLALISVFTDIITPILNNDFNEINPATAIVIVFLVILSGIMKFVQESKSSDAVSKIMKMIEKTVKVLRGKKSVKNIPIDELAVGDVFYLNPGDIVPADARLIESKSLVISQASLTGESDQLERNDNIVDKNYDSITDYPNLVFTGANIITGSATAVALAVGDNTMLGSIAKSVNKPKEDSNFEKGINKVSWILINFMLIMVPIVFFVSGFTKHDWLNAFMFSLSVAIGLTPEMLPMIVTTCLSKGSVSMFKKKVIIKNLNSIQNFGAMNVLCTDKTGTLTEDKIILELFVNCLNEKDPNVLKYAFLNSYFQDGTRNAIDVAITNYYEENEEKIAELKNLKIDFSYYDKIPFDFQRRRISVIIKQNSSNFKFIITKGATEEMMSICSKIKKNNTDEPSVLTDERKQKTTEISNSLNKNGMRVIAIAYKEIQDSHGGKYTIKDESDMILIGFLAFQDPPRSTCKAALKALDSYGIDVKILTGDNEKVTQSVCAKVGLKNLEILMGNEIENMSDKTLSENVKHVNIYAKLNPAQKARIIKILRKTGKVVGYMGDGINDAAAMKKADIGISVDNAVDIAKEAADVILLEKNLMVLENGIIEGRKTYANMIKYIKITSSANFGNMFSVLISSIFLPFLPMSSLHIMILNLTYDTSSVVIPWDNVDKSFLKKPRTWESDSIKSFMIWNGPVSSLFDCLTYLILYFIICPACTGGIVYKNIPVDAIIQSGIFKNMNARMIYIIVFQTGWLIECAWSQVLVFFVLRTKSILHNKPGTLVILLPIAISILVNALIYTPIASGLDLAYLPGKYYMYLLAVLILYITIANLSKKIYIKFKKTWL
ncbi:MAG: magnesium-translocating P-type ATPase [Candidatus Improbicoccus devescovinae]|nr:MAG: magnesium-translocating P-type ATPase [Candidatus Improbicoccus devescovinae]